MYNPNMEIFVTEMSATGHVYVKPLEGIVRAYNDMSSKPGTFEAIGKWSYMLDMEVLDPCSCGQTFLCVGCNQLVGSCSVIGDDDPDLCNDCWTLKQIMKEKLAPGM